MKLDTAADILNWVSTGSRTGCGCCSEEDSPEDIAEAAYLAYCVRVTAIVERGTGSASHEGAYAAFMASILAEAKEQGK